MLAPGIAAADYEAGKRAYDEHKYPVALRELRSLAEAGDPRAMVILGKMYESGAGVRNDYRKAMEYYRKGARMDHVPSMTRYGISSFVGGPSKEDRQQGIDWLRKAAKRGSTEAQGVLGAALIMGLFETPIDLEEGLKWSRKAAAARNLHALNALSHHAAGDEERPPDIVEAFKWESVIAQYEGGDKSEEFMDGLLTKMTPGQVAEARARARAWQAAHPPPPPPGGTATDVEAGRLAFRAKDYPAALRILEPLAADGNPGAMLLLGRMYRWGNGVRRDEAKARAYWQRAATMGHAESQAALGQSLIEAIRLDGPDLPRNNVEAMNWLRRAAEQGSAHGQTYYAFNKFLGGRNIDDDIEDAVMWLRRAAEQGSHDAQEKLADYYYQPHEHRSQEPPDYVEALKWARLAARYANGDGPELLAGWIEKKMSPEQIAEAEARVEAWLADNPD